MAMLIGDGSDAGDVDSWPNEAERGASADRAEAASARRRGRCACSTKPARAATRCSAR